MTRPDRSGMTIVKIDNVRGYEVARCEAAGVGVSGNMAVPPIPCPDTTCLFERTLLQPEQVSEKKKPDF